MCAIIPRAKPVHKPCANTCKYLQPITTVNAAQIFSIYQEACVEMPNADSVEPGDLVICSVNDKNFTEPCGLGKVLKVADVKLKSTHRDGPKGEIFVLAYDKQKVRGSTSIKALKRKLLTCTCCVNCKLTCTSCITLNFVSFFKNHLCAPRAWRVVLKKRY